MEKQAKSITLVYYLVFAIWYVLSLLPFCALYIISDGLFFLVYFGMKYRRDVVRGNLTNSFPEKTQEEIVAIEKKFYHFLCDYFVETLKLMSISRKQMKRRMIFHGLEEVERVYEKEQRNFVFMYLGHYGNWEWIASLPYQIAPSVHCAQIYHPLYNKSMDALFLKLRNQFGGECIPMKNTLRRVIELKRRKQPTIIGFISDQLPKWNSMHFFVPFLHRETAVFTGAEQIGRQVNAAYFFGEIKRPRRGYYECTFKRMELSDEDREMSCTEYGMTALFMKHLEEMINETPEYWLWTHKRWKRTKEEWLERQKETMKNS